MIDTRSLVVVLLVVGGVAVAVFGHPGIALLLWLVAVIVWRAAH